jgi:hypothetical protein
MDGSRHRQFPFLREIGQDLSGKRRGRARGGAKSVKSKSRVSGELCKNCNPNQRFFHLDARNIALHAQ